MPTTTPSAEMANFTPIADDYSIHHLLSNTFGEVTGNVFGTGDPTSLANVMGVAFAYFNSAVLFFGTVILAYVTVFGIMNTANDGKVLGKKWSTAYTPLRIASAAGALLPTSSGYSIIQLIVMQIIAWGVGIADTTWTKVVEAAVDKSLDNAFVAMDGDSNRVKDLAANILKMHVCEKMLTKNLQTLNSANGHDIKVVQSKITHAAITTEYYISRDSASTNWAGAGNDEVRGALCGSYSFSYKSAALSSSTPVSGNSYSVTANMPGLDTEISGTASQLQEISSQMAYQANWQAFQSMDQSLVTLAEQIVSDIDAEPPPDSPSYRDSAFQDAVVTYLETLDQTRKTGIATLRSTGFVKDFLRDSTKYGWVFAGMWHRRLAQIQDALRNAYAVYPQSSGPNDSLVRGVIPTLDQTIKTKYLSAMQKADQAIRLGPLMWRLDPTNMARSIPSTPQLALESQADEYQTVQNWLGDVGQHLVARIIRTLMGSDRDFDTAGSAESNMTWVDPVMQVKTLGDKIITIAENALTTEQMKKVNDNLQRLSRANGLSVNIDRPRSPQTAGLGGLSGAEVEAGWEGLPTMKSISYIGYYLGIFLPMAPFLIFTLAVIGWLIAVVESVIAAPLWMVMHMTPESENTFIGSQKQGYFLLLSVFFRPVLMILALMISLIMLRPVMDFLNIGFIGAMSGIQSESYTGFYSVAGFLLLYAFITSSIFMTVFALPQEMPDRILKWISAGVGSLGEKEAAGRVENMASGSMSSMKQANRSMNSGERSGRNSTQNSQGSGGDGTVGGGSGGGLLKN